MSLIIKVDQIKRIREHVLFIDLQLCSVKRRYIRIISKSLQSTCEHPKVVVGQLRDCLVQILPKAPNLAQRSTMS